MVLARSDWPKETAISLLLFEHLTEPLVRYRRPFGPSDRPRVDLRLRGDAYWLNKAWDDVFVPNLADAASEVIAIVDRQLRRAHRLLRTADPGNSRWDPLSSMLPAIEPHPQQLPRGRADILIRAGRDSIETLLTSDKEIAAGYLVSWAATEVPLLRRLAVHGWVERTDVDATTKLNWLRAQGWLFEPALRHEVFRLIQTALPEADSQVVETLVADAASGPAASGDTERRDYQVFNALTWINQHAPGLQSARDAMNRIRDQHPDFEPREYPDLRPHGPLSGSPGPKASKLSGSNRPSTTPPESSPSSTSTPSPQNGVPPVTPGQASLSPTAEGSSS
jgi:hypothetical protein